MALVVLTSIGVLLAAPLPTSQTVQYQSGDETVKAYLALPASGGRHPGVIVIHEYWGLSRTRRSSPIKATWRLR